MSEPEFRPRPLSARTWSVLGVLALIVVLLYSLVAHFYNAEGGLTFTSTAEASDRGITATVEPMEVNAATNQATVYLTLASVDPALVDSEGRLVENVRVAIQSQSGTSELRFPAGSILSQATVNMGLDGELAQYPFDSHSGNGTITAETYLKNRDGTFTTKDSVYVNADARGGVNGWDTTVAVQETAVAASVTLTFQRAFSTQAFALLLLALAVILAAAAVTVAFLVGTFRRKAEVALMSWTAALLFALPALRNFMPNGPPIGASIDMYIYLWVMAGAIAAAIVVVVSWGRQTAIALKEQASADRRGPGL
jgi:hypothetical protein